MTYAEKLKDPRWQRKRLELLNAANWTCVECGTKTESLHVHHGYYQRKTDPWDYPNDKLRVLCESCHSENQRIMEDVHRIIANWTITDLRRLSQILGPLEFQGERPHVLVTFSAITDHASVIGLWAEPAEENTPDFAWLFDMAMSFEAGQAYRRGWENAQEQAKESASA